MSDTLPPQRSNIELDIEERIKDILIQLGLQEIVTYRLTTPEREAKLLPTASTPPDDRPYVTLDNPISVDRVAMRHSLLASVLESLAANSRFQEGIAIFELGQVYLSSEGGILPDEFRRLSVALAGPRGQEHWSSDEIPAHYDFFDLKGVIEALFDALHLPDLRVEAGEHPTYRPGRSAKLLLADQPIGWMGEVHPLVVEALDILGEWPVIAADLDLESLFARIPDRFSVRAMSAFPAVLEDIAIVVDMGVPAGEVTEVIERSGGALLQRVELFDVYEGNPIPAGKKSLAYHLSFQSPGKTLTDRVVRKNRDRIVKQLKRQFGAILRDA